MQSVDIGDLQGDVAPSARLASRIDGRGAVFPKQKQALSQAKRRTARPGLLGEAEDVAIESAMFKEASDSHGNGELGDAIISLRHQPDPVAVRIDHPLRFLQPLSGNDQFTITAWRRLRQRIRMMVDLDDRALLVMPVLLLSAADRQHVIEAKADILLPEPQHRLQIVRRKSDINDGFRQLHLLTVIRMMYS